MTKKQEHEGNKSVALVTNQGNFSLDIDILNKREQAIKFFNDLLRGRNQGIRTASDAMLVYGRCKELNLPFMNTLEHMCVVQGKICADIHIKTALALRAGSSLYWDKPQDYEPQYKYTDGDNSWISPLAPIPFLKQLAEIDPIGADAVYTWNEANYTKAKEAGKTPIWNFHGHNIAHDYVTSYKFFRTRTMANGIEKTLEAIGSFSSLEGHVAQLGYGKEGKMYAGQRDPNSNWGKYEKRMVDVRAFDNGLKLIAPDLTMGMPEIGEMAEVEGLRYSFDPVSGNASIHTPYVETPINTPEAQVEDTNAEVIDDNAPDGGDEDDSGDDHETP